MNDRGARVWVFADRYLSERTSEGEKLEPPEGGILRGHNIGPTQNTRAAHGPPGSTRRKDGDFGIST